MSSVPAIVGSMSPMPADEARQLVDSIKGKLGQMVRLANELRPQIYRLEQGEGWRALGYSSWRDCVTTEFEQHEVHLYRQLGAAKVEAVLTHGLVGSIPERQLRPLAPYRDQPEVIRTAWQEANERTGGKPTGRIVKEAVDQVIAEREAERRSSPLPGQMSFIDQPEAEDVETEEEEIIDAEFSEVEPAPEFDDEPEDDPDAFALSTTGPGPRWTASELERRDMAERRGLAVVANQRCDVALIAWAKSEGRYVAIDRTSYPLGNPFRIDEKIGMDRAKVIELYRDAWLPIFYEHIDWQSLEGKVLGCWCHPEPCHGHVILEQLAGEDTSEG